MMRRAPRPDGSPERVLSGMTPTKPALKLMRCDLYVDITTVRCRVHVPLRLIFHARHGHVLIALGYKPRPRPQHTHTHTQTYT